MRERRQRLVAARGKGRPGGVAGDERELTGASSGKARIKKVTMEKSSYFGGLCRTMSATTTAHCDIMQVARRANMHTPTD